MLLHRFLPRTEFDSYEDFKANYKVNIPEDFNFGFDVVDAWAEADKNKKALVWCNDHGEEKTFTFSDISRLSNKTANYFRSLGIKKGDVVMMILRRRWEYWICATALHKVGAVLIPGSLQLTKKDIVYRGNSAEVKAIICVNDDFVINQVEASEKEIPTLENKIVVGEPREGWRFFEDEIEPFSDKFARPTGDQATNWNDIMLVYFTSGTTGMPKMVQHNFAHPLGHIVTAKYWQMVQENKLHMSVSDSGWAKFGWGKIYGQWICGAIVFAYDMDKFIPAKLLEVISKYKITTFCAPPTMYRFMLQEDLKKYDLSSIQRCCTAGEPLNPEVIKKWQEYTGHFIYEGFGQSEGSVLLANFQWFEPRLGSTGKPSPIYDIHLVDKDGNDVKTGEEGSIVVMDVKNHPPVGLFTGYYKNPEMTEEKLLGKFYNTDDMASCDEDGYYCFIGRDDDVIKCSGYRIGPFEVESALLEHPSVVECAITGAPDPIRGQVVKATVVLAAGYTPSEELKKELQNHVKRVTAPYKYPRVIEFVDELPKTLGGKIKRGQIRKSDEDAANK
ncbi:MAG: AMP-binding protein [Pseudoruminococcus massiliensis]|jgi:acetyl-CoA synthetase|uniref:AMP-binding protein n=1 Tax=Pseudoruminococcus massiliensis TaxID=2086583 RepID=UPI003996C3F0|nr:AMP-binding protein [Oscillospiraceae bacterium]